MESQTEQSQSPAQSLSPAEESPQDLQQESLLPEPSLESPQVDSQESPPEILGTEDQPESNEIEAASEPEFAPEESVTEQPVQEELGISYESLSDINLDSLTPEIRAHVEPVMGLVQSEIRSLKDKQEGFESAKKEFSELIDAMESSGYDVKPLEARIEEQSQFISTMSENVIETAWQAFTVTHPEFERVPAAARDIFAQELERLFERHDGDTVLDRMNNAYDFALYRAKVDRSSLNEEPVISQVQHTSEQQKSSARRQAVIADGRIATSAPVRSVDELSWDDVLNRHAHLLDR